MKRLFTLVLLAGLFAGLGGCVYDPAYYHRSAVVYDDGTSVYSEPAYYGGYGGYYAPSYYYNPWYAWGWPAISLGFYGGYYGGGHHHHHSGGGHHHH